MIRIIAFVSRRKFSLKREIIVAAIPFASIFIYFVTLFPFPFFNPYQLVETGLERSHNLIPFIGFAAFKGIVKISQKETFSFPKRKMG
ncbi:hypothetical protein M3196_17115 [Fictibacillus nanhaiensis]|uniref:hypothetical protein n=1 Tax=Fictibacillus nanhaiensis TaxID=742169 RepID=UPI002041CE52|nr:hypothetical protein [Fictibacillus nanhaiensis]MCM3733374.1 hypothetical protein [Fictibacillus nanhaiensis]